MSGAVPPDRAAERTDHVSLRVTVAVRGPFARHLRTGRGQELCAAEVGARLDQVISDLGLAARSAVEVRTVTGAPAGPEEAVSPEDWIELRVGGTRCRYPAESLAHLAAAMEGRLAERVSPPLPENWASSPDPEQRTAVLVGTTCAEAVKLRPCVLLGPELIRTYTNDLRGRVPDRLAGVVSPEWLSPVLGGVLDLGITVGDRTLVAQVLAEGAERRPCEARESLVSALCADFVEVLVPETVAAQLGRGDVGDDGDLLGYVTGAMLDENGSLIPAFRVAPPPEGFPAGCFAFRMNSLLTSPMALLAPDDLLVTDTPDQLVLRGIPARPAVNPATGKPAALVAAAEGPRLEAEGLTTWNRVGHVLLCLAHELRVRAGWLVHQDKTQAQLDILATATPALVEAVRSSLQPAALTALLRALAADKVSLRNLPPVLERIVDSAHGHSTASRFAVLGDPVTAVSASTGAIGQSDPAWLEAFVRTGLRRTIADHHTRSSGTLVVHLLDPALERLLRTHGDDEAGGKPEEFEEFEERDGRVIAAIGAVIGRTSQDAHLPHVLTADDVRPALRSVLACVLPRLGIVGYGDLPPDLNIRPVSWITLGDACTDGGMEAAETGTGHAPWLGHTGGTGPPTWYGRCPCGGRYEERRVDVGFTRTHDGTRHVLSDIPQGVCTLCGARVYKLAVLQRIEAVKRAVQDDLPRGG
ncbi:FHIPEP family type III secretion protein [Streptomyces sp. NPDC057302]|uniref:FHIPEP family type III secretion protein n=1 Tax=Streptomyces sp. NPDC057302 TaxID=3346094 RepID=UPI003629B1CE